MVSVVPLRMKENHLVHVQDSGSNHNDFNSVISFHKVKVLFFQQGFGETPRSVKVGFL